MTNPNDAVNPVIETNRADSMLNQNQYVYGNVHSKGGLTKREYIAAIAMQGLLANPEWMKEYKGEKYLMQDSIVSEIACKQADSLIQQLNKP